MWKINDENRHPEALKEWEGAPGLNGVIEWRYIGCRDVG